MRNAYKIKWLVAVIFFVAVIVLCLLKSHSHLPAQAIDRQVAASGSRRISNQSSDTKSAASPIEVTPQKTTGNNDMLFENIQLPLLSMLSQEDIKKAVSFFESQRRSWTAVRNLTAKYTMKKRILNFAAGKSFDAEDQTGTIEFAVTPLDKAKGERVMRMEVRLYDNQSKLTFVQDKGDSQSPLMCWGEDSNLIDQDKRRVYRNLYRQFPIDGMLTPLFQMITAYNDEYWQMPGIMNKETFFSERGVPRRRSTEQEKTEFFGGEAQYLFLASPLSIAERFWFSADTGELRQLDAEISGKGVTKILRYEDYSEEPGGQAKFPRKITLKLKDKDGWVSECTVELSNIKINSEITVGRFEPPSSAVILER